MRPSDMHQTSQRGCWERGEADGCPVPKMTGNRSLDRSILHTRDTATADKLAQYVQTAKRRR